MNWEKLEAPAQLQEIRDKSRNHPVLIFKHSTQCSISGVALDRLQRAWQPEEMKGVEIYYLDLLRHRPISALVAKEFSVEHESPQILLIRNGVSVYDRSHFEINYSDVAAVALAQKV